ncbi:MAG: oxidoreductase [Armatimonadota bacterium]|nr:MAG: oxidoreductase [Armatimonadota bacterium]
MKYANLGRSPLKVSRFCFGTMSFGAVNDAAESERLVRRALDLGVNFFDTAVAYTDGQSEEFLGQAVKGVRDQVVLCTKFGSRQEIGTGINDRQSSRYHLVRALETSLRRLQTDYVDLYLLHMPHPGMNLEETLSALDDVVRQGKALYVGCSNFPAWLLCKSLWLSDVRGWCSFRTLQSAYNLIERGVELEILPLCHAEGIAFMAYRGLCRGILAGQYLESGGDADERASLLQQKHAAGVQRLQDFAASTGRTPAQAALAWLLAHPAVTCAVVGPTRKEELEELAAGVDHELTADQREELTAAFPVKIEDDQIGVHATWRTRLDLLL